MHQDLHLNLILSYWSSTHLFHYILCDGPQVCGFLVLALTHCLLHCLCCISHLVQSIVIQQRL